MIAKPLLIFSTAIALVISGLFFLNPRETEVHLLQQSPPDIYPFTDSLSQGNSTIPFADYVDGVLRLEMKLDSGAAWPHVGTQLSWADSTEPCQNWSSFDTLWIKYQSQKSTAFAISVLTRIPVEERISPKEVRRNLQQTVPIAREIQSYGVPLKDFHIPDWWKREYKIPYLQNKAYWDQVCRLSIGASSIFSPLGKMDTIQIYSIILRGQTQVYSSLGTLCIVSGILLLLLPIFKPKTFGFERGATPVPVQMQNENQEWLNRVREFYHTHYVDPNLNTEKAATGLATHVKKLQQTLKNDFQTTHKAYLNEIRIKEATRLVESSERAISEIALAVGFNTVPHFNRIFKQIHGFSPSEFRARSE